MVLICNLLLLLFPSFMGGRTVMGGELLHIPAAFRMNAEQSSHRGSILSTQLKQREGNVSLISIS